jgi:ATP-dependent Clp protease ATP-binding subunit ClpA
MDVEQVVSKITKIPEKSITANDRYYLKDLDKKFKKINLWPRSCG